MSHYEHYNNQGKLYCALKKKALQYDNDTLECAAHVMLQGMLFKLSTHDIRYRFVCRVYADSPILSCQTHFTIRLHAERLAKKKHTLPRTDSRMDALPELHMEGGVIFTCNISNRSLRRIRWNGAKGPYWKSSHGKRCTV